MSAIEGHGTGGQVQARGWRPRISAALETEPDPVQSRMQHQKPVPQPRPVRKTDHQEQMPQQQPIPVVQLAPATQRPAPDVSMYAPPPGPAVQQPVQPTPVLQHMPPPYPISQGATQQQSQRHATQPQSAAAPAVATEKLVNKLTTGNYKMKWKVNSMFCTIWRGILEIIARSGAIAVAVLLFALSSAVIHTINNNDALAALGSLDSSLFDTATGTNVFSELQSLIEGSRGVSGLMIFTAIAILIVEVPVIVGRFTLLLGTGWLRILHVVDAVCNVILAIFLLSGAAAAASYSARWSEPPTACDDSVLGSSAAECDQDTLTGMLGAIAFLGLIGLGITVFLTVWTIIAAVKKWDHIENENNAD